MGGLGVGSNYLEALRAAPPDLLTHAPVEGLERVMSGELQTLTLEYPSRSPGGRERWFLMCVDAMPPEHGGLVISYTDITERKHTEQTLEEALAEVRQLKDRLHEENIYLQEAMMVAHDFGEIIGRSEALKRTLRQAEQVAPLDTTVLLSGETGTGKELLAHAIHNLSSRKGHTLVKVNCATLPAQLVESELFGHERGAFTGAHSKRVGRFEIANGGTIFLDEIGELPLDLQAKLLRVLQEGEFERLGSSHTVRVDVRVIAATNRNLEEAVHQGTFRSDLYYRLSIFPITIPPLRERREDIPMLVTHFVRQLGLKLGKQIESIPQETMDALLNYPWPGNVRELRNVIERAAIITQGPKLRLLDSLESGAIDQIPQPSVGAALQLEPARVQTLDENQRSLIIQTLDNTYWRVEGPNGAAALLGIHPNTLRSRMKKLGIVKPRFKHPSHAGAAAAHGSPE
jgi:transcriptional regulator with GAF, ATPase, and Fis domain